MAFLFKSILVFILCLQAVPTPSQGQLLFVPPPCLGNHHLGIIVLSVATSPVMITSGKFVIVGFLAIRVTSIPDENIEVGTSLKVGAISTAPVEERSFVPLCDSGDTCTPTGFIGKFKQQIPTDAFGPYVFRIEFRDSISKTNLGCAVVPLLVTKN